MDFWRPVNRDEALFDSKLSVYNYLKSLDIVFARFLQKVNFTASDIDYACFHVPFCKMARKANSQIFKDKPIENALLYNTVIGNSCSASMYISFLSLLDNTPADLTEKRIGFYSYGSGSVAEFFSGIVVDGYETMLSPEHNRKMLADRAEISFHEYENFCQNRHVQGKIYKNICKITMAGIEYDKRIYNTTSE
jgi:hydroxymethylglutaryl-CoA synthase